MIILTQDLVLLLQYLLLAIIQGISEILPISSSGHTLLLENIFDMELSLSFSIFLHLGSLIAVLFYFRKDILSLIKNTFYYIKTREEIYLKEFQLCIFLCIATIPAAIIGALFSSVIDRLFCKPIIVCCNFIITGILLLLCDSFKEEKGQENMSIKDAFFIGLAQAIGVLPGISRSGITITSMRYKKYNRKDSARFSFLLFLPISFGSFFYEVIHIIKEPLSFSTIPIFYLCFSVLVSCLCTYLSLQLFFKFIQKKKLSSFSIYLFLISALYLLFFL